MTTQARGGYEYFFTFVDDYSRFSYIYLMQHKSETCEKFKKFQFESKKQLGKSIKCLQSKQCGEHLDSEFKDHLLEHGILS